MFQLTQSKETQGDKNRHVLRKLYNIDDSDFDRFLDHLKTTQPKVCERINNVKAQVHAGRKSSETTSEDDFGNDFDRGMILNMPHLSLLKFLILTHFMDVLCQQVDMHWICNSIIKHIVHEKLKTVIT
jgi:hypothetical protein